MFPWMKIDFDLYNGRFKEALFKAEVADPADFRDRGTRYLVLAEIHGLLNNDAIAREYYKNALEFFNGNLADNPDDPLTLSLLGISAAGLNDKIKAIEAGQKAVRMAESQYMEKKWRIRDLAQIYVMVREYNRSLLLLEELLNSPSDFSIKMLQLDPVWRPLRENQGFKRLVKTYLIKVIVQTKDFGNIC